MAEERGFLLARAMGHAKLFSVGMLQDRGLINWKVIHVVQNVVVSVQLDFWFIFQCSGYLALLGEIPPLIPFFLHVCLLTEEAEPSRSGIKLTVLVEQHALDEDSAV